MLPLSNETLERIRSLFPKSVWARVVKMMEDECGNNLPFCEDSDEFSIERIRFAALKLSEGTIEGLVDAVVLAQTDWRDLLVAAGFADDINIHKDWRP